MTSSARPLTVAEIESLCAAATAFFEQQTLTIESGWGPSVPQGELALRLVETLPDADLPEKDRLWDVWTATKRGVLGQDGQLSRAGHAAWTFSPAPPNGVSQV